MGLGNFVEMVASLLDPAERVTVLGDIQERGVNILALFDLIGLVALRQLEAWRSWRTWVFVILMGIPILVIASGAQVIGDTASYYPWPDLSETRRVYFLGLIACRIVAIVGLAWATGFSIASLAKYRAISVLAPLAFIIVWQPIGLAPLLLLVGVPSLFGLRRGLRGDQLTPKAVFILAILCLPAFAIPNYPTWTARIYTVGAFWPAFYAVGYRFSSPGPSEDHDSR